MSYKLPSSASRALVTVVSVGCAVGTGALLYERHVVGNPMTIFRDGEGVLRFQTRRDLLERRAAEAQARLQLEPEAKQLQYAYAIARRELELDMAKDAKTAAPRPMLTDADLK